MFFAKSSDTLDELLMFDSCSNHAKRRGSLLFNTNTNSLSSPNLLFGSSSPILQQTQPQQGLQFNNNNSNHATPQMPSITSTTPTTTGITPFNYNSPVLKSEESLLFGMISEAIAPVCGDYNNQNTSTSYLFNEDSTTSCLLKAISTNKVNAKHGINNNNGKEEEQPTQVLASGFVPPPANIHKKENPLISTSFVGLNNVNNQSENNVLSQILNNNGGGDNSLVTTQPLNFATAFQNYNKSNVDKSSILETLTKTHHVLQPSQILIVNNQNCAGKSFHFNNNNNNNCYGGGSIVDQLITNNNNQNALQTSHILDRIRNLEGPSFHNAIPLNNNIDSGALNNNNNNNNCPPPEEKVKGNNKKKKPSKRKTTKEKKESTTTTSKRKKNTNKNKTPILSNNVSTVTTNATANNCNFSDNLSNNDIQMNDILISPTNNYNNHYNNYSNNNNVVNAHYSDDNNSSGIVSSLINSHTYSTFNLNPSPSATGQLRMTNMFGGIPVSSDFCFQPNEFEAFKTGKKCEPSKMIKFESIVTPTNYQSYAHQQQLLEKKLTAANNHHGSGNDGNNNNKNSGGKKAASKKKKKNITQLNP